MVFVTGLFDPSGPSSESPGGDAFPLNDAQQAAVRHGDGPLLVVAGAGTGKTRVIIARICHLLQTRPELSGENILALTFTDKAAGEMRSRLRRAIGERADGVTLTTFHSFCSGLLRDLDPAMRVLDDVDHWIFLRRRLARLQLRQYLRLSNPGKFLTDFTKFFSRCQDELVTHGRYQAWVDELARLFEAEKLSLDADARADREALLLQQQEVSRAYATSEALLREAGFRTYGSLLLGAVEELRNNAALREKLRERYRFLLIDEFQDTNVAQIELLRLLAGPERNVFAVGDNDQAVYQFRGASHSTFTLFLERIAGVTPAPGALPANVVLLNSNYRSTKRILRVSDQVISMNERPAYLPGKALETQNPPGAKIRLAEFDSPAAEAHWVAEDLVRRRAEGVPWSAFALLYRIHAHRAHLMRALEDRDIPYIVRNRSILDNALVRDLLAHLRLLGDLHDDVACARVLGVPCWGLEPADLVRLSERASKSRGVSLWDALLQAQTELPFSEASKRIPELVDWITRLRKLRYSLTVRELFELLVGEMGLRLLPEGEHQMARDRLGKFLEDWEQKNETRRLAEFLEYFDYFLEAGGQINFEEDPAGDAVRLMTVHAAKGLEFPHVYILRLTNGSFPTREREVLFRFPPELMQEEPTETAYHIQEERRLFYVAGTRAQQSLTLCGVVNRRSKPSPFLEDITINPALMRADVQRLAPRVTASPDAAAPPVPLRTALFGRDDLGFRAGSRIAEWALTYRPPLGAPLKLSDSAIESYAACPQKYLFGYQWGLRGGPQAALTFGNVMHGTVKELVDALHKNHRVPFEDVEAIYERRWSSAGYRDAFQEDEYRKAGLEQLRAFHAATTQSPPDVLAQERSFEMPGENDIVVTGRMDQINRLDGDKIEIVDYKTGTPKDETSARKSLQLSIYALAARDVLEKTPARLSFYNLVSNEAVSAGRSTAQLEKASVQIQETAAGIRAREFAPAPGYLCKFCDFRLLCPAHENTGSAQD